MLSAFCADVLFSFTFVKSASYSSYGHRTDKNMCVYHRVERAIVKVN